MPRVDRVKAKYVTKKITISLSVLTVKYKMRSIDHIHLPAASIAGLFPPSRRKQLLRRRPLPRIQRARRKHPGEWSFAILIGVGVEIARAGRKSVPDKLQWSGPI